MDYSIRILEQDHDLVHIVGSCPNGQIEVLASLMREGDTLILRGLHVQGPGPRELGLRDVRGMARELGRLFGVHRLVIYRWRENDRGQSWARAPSRGH